MELYTSKDALLSLDRTDEADDAMHRAGDINSVADS
jgi:hypothetical protein